MHIRDRCYHHCLIDLEHGFEANSPEPANITLEPTKGTACLGDSALDLLVGDGMC